MSAEPSSFARHFSNNPTLLFVYGTLMQGQGANHLLGGCEFVGKCSVPGVLLHLGPFPGLIEHNVCRVTGEVYRVGWRTLIGSLDSYEQVHSGLYQRRQVKVPFDPGVAWTYYKLGNQVLDDKTMVVERGIWTHSAAGRIPYKDLLDYFQNQRWREPANRTGPQPILGAVPEHIQPQGQKAEVLALPAPKKDLYKDIIVEPGLEEGEQAL